MARTWNGILILAALFGLAACEKKQEPAPAADPAKGNVSLPQEVRYQNVRIIAVYDTDQIPALQG